MTIRRTFYVALLWLLIACAPLRSALAEKVQIVKGTTSYSATVFLLDSTSTTGAGKTGLIFSDITAYYAQPATASTSIAMQTLAAVTTTFATGGGGFKEIDQTNMPGCYRFDIPNAALTGANSVVVMLRATGAVPLPIEIQLTSFDPNDAVRLGLTALPNVASGSSGAIPTTGTGSNQIDVDSAGRVNLGKAFGTAVTLDSNNVLNVSTKYLGGTTQTARDIGASVLLSPGTGTGQLDITSGVTKANATQFAGQTITAAAGVTLPSSVASPTNITAGTITTVTNLTNAPTSGDLTATMKASVTTAATAATPTAAAVTGSVGSVTGLTASNLDTTISSRMATYTQPTGFLTATFPSGTIANTTNITAGTITTATNLTNAPTAGDFTATMKTSLGTAVGTAQTGDSFARIGLAGVGLTNLGDARLANLDALISSRSTFDYGTNKVTLVDNQSPYFLTGTASASSSTTLTLATGPANLGDWNGVPIDVTSGTGVQQRRIITDSQVNGVITVSPAWNTTPASNCTYGLVRGIQAKLDSNLAISRVTLTDTATTITNKSGFTTTVEDLLQADRWIDKTTSPSAWALVLIKKNTGALGVGTELLRQPLYDVDGNALHSTTTTIGRSISP